MCSSELPDDVRARRAFVEGGELRVEWAHDHRESRYALAWLERHAYAKDRDKLALRAPPNDVGGFEIDGAELSVDGRVERALHLVRERGAAIVRVPARERNGAEQATESIIDAFAARGLSVIPTHFGRIEDLRTDNTTNANTDQLGYTDAAVELHTDQPFLDEPPHFQMLHAIRAADEGGHNAIVDALGAAEALRAEDADAYAILTSTPVTFHRTQKSFERVVVSPILSRDRNGRFRVRYSYFTMAPHKLPFDEMEGFYRAYDRFARLVRSPQNQVRFLLEPGDFLLYDNHRMLHARTSFRGPRWMRGVYFDVAA